jgi:hypothetical protein
MNIELEEYARAYLKNNLTKCTDRQFIIFKKMHAEKHPERSIEETVDKLPSDRLDWAMQQVARTLNKEGIEPWNFHKTSIS